MAICNSAARRPRFAAIARRLSSIHPIRTQGTNFKSWVSESGGKAAIAGTPPEGETHRSTESEHDNGKGQGCRDVDPGTQRHLQSYEHQNEGYPRLQVDELVQH